MNAPKVLSTVALVAALQGPAMASSYEAICGTSTCTIGIDATGLSSPAGFLPTGRIAQWFTGGQEDFNAASGTAGALGAGTAGAIAGAVLLGPIGLLGGLIGGAIAGSKAGKTADLYFSVVGYDQAGIKQTISFRFVNPKPANQLKMELPMFTGLGMGQSRSVEELRKSLSASTVSSPLPEKLTPSSGSGPASTGGSKTLPDSLAVPVEAKADPLGGNAKTAGDWSSYLKDRGLENWASKNPQLAEKLKQRLYPSN
jgi:hypothetical protein